MRTRGRVQRLSCVRPSMRRARNHQSWMLPSARTPSESCDIGSKSILASLLCHISSSEPPTEWSAGEPQTDSKSIWASCCATSRHQSCHPWHECEGGEIQGALDLSGRARAALSVLAKRVLLDYLRKLDGAGTLLLTLRYLARSCQSSVPGRRGGTCYREVSSKGAATRRRRSIHGGCPRGSRGGVKPSKPGPVVMPLAFRRAVRES